MDATDSGRDRVDLFHSRRNRMRGEESYPGTESQLGEPIPMNWSLLWSLGVVIRSVEFPVGLMLKFIKFPPWLIYTCLLSVLDPYGTMRRVRRYLLSTIVKICDLGLKNRKPVLEMVRRLSWGLFWAVYDAILLFALLFFAFMISAFLITKLVHEPIVIKENLNFDYTKNSPEAYVPITSCAAIGFDLSFKEGFKVFDSKPPNHRTEITVSMTLPDSEYNRNLGMFQVRVDFLSVSGRVLATSRRSGMVRFRSGAIRFVRNFVKIVPLVTGYVSEIQTLNLKLKGFEEEDIVPTACLKVMIEQRAEFLHGGAGIPEIYDATLFLESKLPFFKRIIWNWRRTLFVWISMCLLFALVCFGHPILPRTGYRTQQRRRTPSINNNSDMDGQMNQ